MEIDREILVIKGLMVIPRMRSQIVSYYAVICKFIGQLSILLAIQVDGNKNNLQSISVRLLLFLIKFYFCENSEIPWNVKIE